MVKDHSARERKPAAATTWVTLFDEQQKILYIGFLIIGGPNYFHSEICSGGGGGGGIKQSFLIIHIQILKGAKTKIP